jgi:phthiocerol/phenolphthiocerol synthesis type-I polyketide synthase C
VDSLARRLAEALRSAPVPEDVAAAALMAAHEPAAPAPQAVRAA